MKIYEINYELYNRLFNEREEYLYEFDKTPDYLYAKFIVKNKNGKGYFCVDNSTNEWWEEEFKNKTQCLMFLVEDELTAEQVIDKYNKNKNAYKHYGKFLVSQDVFCEKNNIYHRDYFNFDPKKEYNFTINFGNCTREFSSTIENALGLASNYETDLQYKGILIFSSLGFDWEENCRLIERYLGKNFDRRKFIYKDSFDDYGLPYRKPTDGCFNFKDEKIIKM